MCLRPLKCYYPRHPQFSNQDPRHLGFKPWQDPRHPVFFKSGPTRHSFQTRLTPEDQQMIVFKVRFSVVSGELYEGEKERYREKERGIERKREVERSEERKKKAET